MRLFSRGRNFKSNDSQHFPIAGEYPYFEIADIKQGTSAWRSWRKKVIGASDAPTIMGENRFNSIDSLINEKLGLQKEFAGNAVTREGQQLEEVARRILEKELGFKVFPTVIQDGKTPFIAASLDGINEEHSQVFEIKCGAKSYDLAYKRNEIPRYYIGQLQHILMITQLKKIMYVAYRPNSELVTIDVNRDDSYISRLRDTEKKFGATLVRRGHKLQDKFIGKPISRS